MGEHDEFISDFLEECDENLDQLDQDLVALEENPRDDAKLRSIFRNIHTVKGSSGFFGFAKIGALAHEGESLLGKLRDGELLFDAEIASGLLSMSDAIREILVSIEQTGLEGEKDFAAVLDALADLLSREREQKSAEGVPTVQPEPDHVPDPPSHEKVVSEQVGPNISEHDLEALADIEGTGEEIDDVEIAQEESVRSAAEISDTVDVAATRTATRQNAQGGVSKTRSIEGSTEPTSIRVDVQILDQLMDFAGELVLARNSLSRCSDELVDPRLSAVANRISQITSEIQDRVTQTRMQPIGGIWGKFRRIVRDLAVECGKQVRLEMAGEETELDRSLIEAIKDPLTHLLRNSVDHGVETADERVGRGKSPEGVVRLEAQHQSGQVVIHVADDGGGIDVEKIRTKAVTSGLVSKEEAAGAGAQEVLNYIFEPGFSTAATISSISGRGVGMDVVRSHVERIGGTVHIESELGFGTKFTIRLPLTLAIVPALVLRVKKQIFALPQACLREVVTVGESSQVEWIHDVPVYRLRGHLLPLVSLDRLLGVTNEDHTTSARQDLSGQSLGSSQVAVLQIEQLRFGLIIDEVVNSQEVVVKPIGKAIKAIGAYSAATILGDGTVALILDVSGIARMAGLSQELQGKLDHVTEGNDIVAGRGIPRQDSGEKGENGESGGTQAIDLAIDAVDDRTLLVCEIDHSREIAISMDAVDRLEEVSIENLQAFDTHLVTSYRGSVLRIRSLYDVFEQTVAKNSSPLIICQHEGNRFGVLVKQINDVIDVSLEMNRDDADELASGLPELDDRFTLVRGRVVEVLDVEQQYHFAMGDAR
jgi:two-component system chemotaxis sensor kinase CheA